MQTIKVMGGDLFRIALQYLGDATQWQTIARLNNLDDPILSGPITLVLPDSPNLNTTAVSLANLMPLG
jgi:hypothetical protein